MVTKDKANEEFSGNQLRQMRQVFNEGLEQVVLSVLNEIVETQDDHTDRLALIGNRQEAEQGTLDRHDRRISSIEKHIGFKPVI